MYNISHQTFQFGEWYTSLTRNWNTGDSWTLQREYLKFKQTGEGGKSVKRIPVCVWENY